LKNTKQTKKPKRKLKHKPRRNLKKKQESHRKKKNLQILVCLKKSETCWKIKI